MRLTPAGDFLDVLLDAALGNTEIAQVNRDGRQIRERGLPPL